MWAGAHWSIPSKPASMLGSFQSAVTALGLGASKSMHMLFNSIVSVSYSPHSLVFKSAKRAHLPGVGPQGWGA